MGALQLTSPNTTKEVPTRAPTAQRGSLSIVFAKSATVKEEMNDNTALAALLAAVAEAGSAATSYDGNGFAAGSDGPVAAGSFKTSDNVRVRHGINQVAAQVYLSADSFHISNFYPRFTPTLFTLQWLLRLL